MRNVLPPEQQKPLYMMEFGTRGFNTCSGKPPLPAANQDYYRDAACTDIWRTNIAAFQQIWFDVDSAQLGVAGTSKWDAYWSRYDNSSVNNQFYWMVGPPTEGSPLTPTYYAMSLLFHTTAPEWQIIGVEPWGADDWSVNTYRIEGHSSDDQPEKDLVGCAGQNGDARTERMAATLDAIIERAATLPDAPDSPECCLLDRTARHARHVRDYRHDG